MATILHENNKKKRFFSLVLSGPVTERRESLKIDRFQARDPNEKGEKSASFV